MDCFKWLLWVLGMGRKKRGVKVRNMTENMVELQIRVGSIMVRSYRVYPHSCSTLPLPCRKLRESMNPFFYEGLECEPYLWIHLQLNSSSAFFMSSPDIAKQHFVSLSDLSRCISLTISSSSSSSTSVNILKKFR